MEQKIIRALKVPSPDPGDEKRGIAFVAALTPTGEWIDLIETPAGREPDALAAIARAHPEADLRCEPALAEGGHEGGWRAEEIGDEDVTRAIASYVIALGGGAYLYPLAVAETFVEIAVDFRNREPWRDPELDRGLPLCATSGPAAPANRLEKRAPELFLALTAPPARGVEPMLVLAASHTTGIAASFSRKRLCEPVRSWLARKGSDGVVPYVLAARRGLELQEPLSGPDLVKAMALMSTVARGRTEGVELRIADCEIRTQWLPPAIVRPVKGPPKQGRNEPCHCGSGKKYKKCHLLADELATSDARMQVRPMGKGGAELIFATDGKPVPEGGYDDCPICRAQSDEERIRLMREHSGGTLH